MAPEEIFNSSISEWELLSPILHLLILKLIYPIFICVDSRTVFAIRIHKVLNTDTIWIRIENTRNENISQIFYRKIQRSPPSPPSWLPAPCPG